MILDPHLFTKIIIFLYTLNILNYSIAKYYGNAFYWLCALGITVSATWFVKH